MRLKQFIVSPELGGRWILELTGSIMLTRAIEGRLTCRIVDQNLSRTDVLGALAYAVACDDGTPEDVLRVVSAGPAAVIEWLTPYITNTKVAASLDVFVHSCDRSNACRKWSEELADALADPLGREIAESATALGRSLPSEDRSSDASDY